MVHPWVAVYLAQQLLGIVGFVGHGEGEDDKRRMRSQLIMYICGRSLGIGGGLGLDGAARAIDAVDAVGAVVVRVGACCATRELPLRPIHLPRHNQLDCLVQHGRPATNLWPR